MTAGTVRVDAQPVQQGRTAQLWQVDITNPADGKLVARGQVRLQNVPLPHPDRQT
jgi:acyl-coenzyme A thioesterase PaaI-like protein